jgi:hypothetical protein
MELHAFKSYAHYIKAQKRTLHRRGIGPYFSVENIDDICNWLKAHKARVRRGICHGARCGREADQFLIHFPKMLMFGTDIVPKSGKASRYKTKCDVIQHDFMNPVKRWENKFDVLYSNSLDHAYDPVACLETWFGQLKPERGHMFIHWNTSDRGTGGGGDCFGAHLDEYIDLLNDQGQVVDLIYSMGTGRRCWGPSIILVAKRGKWWKRMDKRNKAILVP